MDASLRSLLGWSGVVAGSLGLLVGSLACGPIRSTSSIGRAEVELERARVNEAYRKSPYEFFSARYYLHKAKEEWGYSEFEISFEYADQAKEAAENARRRAKEDPWKDPVEGREKSYELTAQETITIDPGEVRESERSPRPDRSRSGSDSESESSSSGSDSPSSSDDRKPSESDSGGAGETGEK